VSTSGRNKESCSKKKKKERKKEEKRTTAVPSSKEFGNPQQNDIEESGGRRIANKRLNLQKTFALFAHCDRPQSFVKLLQDCTLVHCLLLHLLSSSFTFVLLCFSLSSKATRTTARQI
jgi:hypothetical protein